MASRITRTISRIIALSLAASSTLPEYDRIELRRARALDDPDINGNTNLYVARMDTPWSIVQPQVMFTKPEFDWEQIGCRVNDGPAVFHWHNTCRMITDVRNGLAVYRSTDALRWSRQPGDNLLQQPALPWRTSDATAVPGITGQFAAALRRLHPAEIRCHTPAPRRFGIRHPFESAMERAGGGP